jgi:glycosyltransferase involved in cell wall biosynthesis
MHVITGLDVGGAELMLKRLIEAHHGNANYRHVVISLITIGKVGQQLQALGVEVQAMGMRSPLDIPVVVWQLVRLIRATRPDIVQTWMYHADLIGGLAARLAGNRNVVWGVRCTAIPQRVPSTTHLVVSLCSWLSRLLPSVIVCCAESVRVVHAEKGYDQKKMVVIPNGYDLKHFNKNPMLRRKARAAFGIGDDEVVVGTVGRFDPLKDYRNFVRSAMVLASQVERLKFLMVGPGMHSGNKVLWAWLADSESVHKFVLAGESNDIPGCLAAMDVFCLSSSKEGFPNVVCEAMAMNVPCVVTRAGDAAEIVADTGIVVAPDDSKVLTEALRMMLSKGPTERLRLGELARLRIEKHYTIEIASARFEAIYEKLTQQIPQIVMDRSVTN